jgi:4-amino-4-deoxy-L-arabinose transferase-like glycosyltransferase
MNIQTKIENFLDKETSVKWLIFCAALMLLVMLGARELWTQEWRWANISWNMMFSGDYFHPYLVDAPYYDKPLLSYWLMIAFSKVMGGLSTLSLRLPAALAGILAIFCTYRVGSILINRRAGFIAGWMLATTFYFIFWARTANTDMLNVAGIMLATMWYFQRREQPGFVSYSIYFLILAISALFKGLIAPVISILVALPDLLANQQWKKHLRWQLIPALVSAVIVYATPFILSSHFGGTSYTENGFVEVWQENVVRYFRPFDHEDPIYCYFMYLPLYMLPWTVLFIPALIALYKRWQTMTAGSRWTAWSTLLIFLFLTVSGSRRNYYVLPLVPFATLLTADWIAAGFVAKTKRIYTAVIMGICSYLAMFIYYDILIPVYYSEGGLTPFVRQVHAQANAIHPWPQWNIVFLDAESKVSLYIKPTKPVQMLSVIGSTQAQRDKYRQNYSVADLLRSWPILLQHEPNTILISRKLYLNKLQPYLRGYKIIVAPPDLGERLLQQDDSADPVAFIPIGK